MNKLQANLCLLSVTIIWSSELIVLSCIPDSVEPVATTCITKTIGSILLFCCFFGRILNEIKTFKWELLRKALTVALLNCVYNTMVIVGFRSFDSITGNFVYTFTAVSMPVLLLVLGRKVSKAMWVTSGLILIGILLQAGGMLRGNRVVFPGLPEIWQALFRLLGTLSTYQKIGITLLHVIEALAISAGIGILAGLAEGLSEWIHSFFRPLMILIRSIPMIVLVILIMSIQNYRSVPVTAACMILIPMLSEAVYEGCRSLDPEMIDVYRMNGGFGFQVAIHVYLPMIAGYLKQAFANAAGMGLKIAVSAEYLVQARDSLGKAVYSSAYFSEYAEIYAYAMIMILLVLLITDIPEILIRLKQKRKENG